LFLVISSQIDKQHGSENPADRKQSGREERGTMGNREFPKPLEKKKIDCLIFLQGFTVWVIVSSQTTEQAKAKRTAKEKRRFFSLAKPSKL
jgi:hypothetical protein